MRTRAAGEGMVLYRTAEFPSTRHVCTHLRYSAVVGIGGNVGDVGDVMRRFARLLVALGREKGVEVVRTGPVLKNPPFGYLDQPDFYNSVIEMRTSMQPRRFLRFLLRMEKRFGRRRSFANAPRTLDLDLIFFDGRSLDYPELTVPHPHWRERPSVVIPLAYFGVNG